MKMKMKLFKLAMWYISRCNKEWNKQDNIDVSKLKKLTYHDIEKYHLKYGLEHEWKNFARYNVIDNAIQKLGKYEWEGGVENE